VGGNWNYILSCIRDSVLRFVHAASPPAPECMLYPSSRRGRSGLDLTCRRSSRLECPCWFPPSRQCSPEWAYYYVDAPAIQYRQVLVLLTRTWPASSRQCDSYHFMDATERLTCKDGAFHSLSWILNCNCTESPPEALDF